MVEGTKTDTSAEGSSPWSTSDLLTAVLLHRVLVSRLSLGFGLCLGLITLLTPVAFTSRATLATPPAGLLSPGLGGLAAQFGLGSGLTGASRPPAFYIRLARSDAMLQALVQGQYAYEVNDTLCRCDLVAYLAPGVEPRGLAIELAARALQDRVGVTTTKEAGTLELSTTFHDPRLAQQVTGQLLGEIDRFNLRERHERASAERLFLAERLDSARSGQNVAERELEAFLTQNREFQNSPALRVRYERLNREARLRQELTATLNDAYEKARLEESRNTEVLVRVAGPSLPAQRDGRFLIIKVIVATLAGFGLGVMLSWGIEVSRDPSLRGFGSSTSEAARLAAKRDLHRPWRLLGIANSR